MTTGPLVNTLLVVGVVSGVATLAAFVLARFALWVARLLAPVFAPVRRAREQRDARERARLREEILHERRARYGRAPGGEEA